MKKLFVMSVEGTGSSRMIDVVLFTNKYSKKAQLSRSAKMVEGPNVPIAKSIDLSSIMGNLHGNNKD